MSKALDNTHAIGKSLTLPGAAFSGVFGFVDGFLGGMMSDIIEPWNTDQKCKDLKEDFSDGLRKVVHSFKHLLHSLRHNCKRILTSREARRNVLRAIKKVLRELLDFLASVSSGLWHCPATKMIGITGIISAAIAANVAFLAAGLVVVPLIIKWVGAMVGLYFSFEYLMATGKTLARNVAKARRRNMCRKSCKEAIVEKSFAIAGCLTEVVVMGAIGDIISFGRANPAKVAAAGSKSSKFKVRFNDDLIHDLRVLKVAAINAKHKTVGKFSSLASKFKSGKQLKASAAKPKKTLSKVRGDDFYSVKNRLGGADNPIKSMDEAEDLMRQNKFACDAGENGPVPILDDVKKKEGTISDEMYQKEF